MANPTNIVMLNGIQWYTRTDGSRSRTHQMYYWLGTPKSHEARIFVRREQRSPSSKAPSALLWQVYQDNVLVERSEDLDTALKKAFARWKDLP